MAEVIPITGFTKGNLKPVDEGPQNNKEEEFASNMVVSVLSAEEETFRNTHVEFMLKFSDKQVVFLAGMDGNKFEETTPDHVLNATSKQTFQIEEAGENIVRLKLDGDFFYDLYINQDAKLSMPDLLDKAMDGLYEMNDINLKIKGLNSQKFQLEVFGSAELDLTEPTSDVLRINSSHAAEIVSSDDLSRKGDRDLIPKEVVESVDEIFVKTEVKRSNINYDIEGRYFEDPEASHQQIQTVIDKVRNGDEIDPVIIDRKGNALDGQHRMSAFDFLGVEDVPVYKSYTEETVFDNLATRRETLGIENPEAFFQNEFTPTEPDNDGLEVVYRGVSSSSDGSNFYSNDKEFARKFTKNGRDEEIITATIKSSDIFESYAFAGSEDEMIAAVTVAESIGKSAVRLDEGSNQPKSIFIIEESALNPHLDIKRTGSDKDELFELAALFDKEIRDQFREDIKNALMEKDAETYSQESGGGIYRVIPFDDDKGRAVDVLFMGKDFSLDKADAIFLNKSINQHDSNSLSGVDNNYSMEF